MHEGGEGGGRKSEWSLVGNRQKRMWFACGFGQALMGVSFLAIFPIPKIPFSNAKYAEMNRKSIY
jgi:hypothetical protein